MKKISFPLHSITNCAMFAALYVLLTMISAVFGLSSSAIQIRISEALCVLPVFTPYAIPGITIGCFLSNLLTGGTIWDLTIGVMASLIGLAAARLLRKWPFLAPIPTILSNALLIPLVLAASGIIPATVASYILTICTVGIGESISCGLFGTLLTLYLHRHPKICETLHFSKV